VTHNTLSPQAESTRQDDQLSAELNEAVQSRAQAVLQNGTLHNDGGYVEISTEKRPTKERRILATVNIPQPIEQVWQVITDYEHLADFVPNLTSSKRLPDSTGRIRLEQIGSQCFLKFKFCARVVLHMSENFPHELGFTMEEGDFRKFEGAWKLQTSDDAQSTQLSYDLCVKPPRAMPAALIEHHICHNLTLNLLAIRQRALEMA
jgi:ribosome-associated toxin RatA of RatAB toxin-antitoxin module